jgi:hypothetical protein
VTDRPRPDLTPAGKDAVAFQSVVLLGSLPDLAVTLVRLARGHRGVQLGPTLVTLVLAAGAPTVGRWAVRRRGRLGAAALLAYGSAVVLAPAAAAPVRVTVLGDRSAAWQLAISAAVRGVSACLTVLPVALAAARQRPAAELSRS